MSGRRWWRRATLTLGAYAGLLIAGVATDLDPDPVALLLVVGVLVLLGGALLDGLPSGDPVGAADHPTWHLDDVRSEDPRGRDARTAVNLRLLESHASARVPDQHLRDRFALLAEQQLRTHCGHGLDSPGADELLGPVLTGVVNGPVRRLRRAEIVECVQRIEEL